jgi:hypothetical protein
MYIVPTNASYTQVGFISTNGTAPTGAVTTGFAWFGTQVAYAASASDYELMFWATETNATGIYGLYVSPSILRNEGLLTFEVERCWRSFEWLIPCGCQKHSSRGSLTM